MKPKYLRPVTLSILLAAGVVSAGARGGLAAEPIVAGEGGQGVTQPVLQPHSPRYQLRIGDTIDVSFRITPEFNQTVTVQPDGFISLRDIADVNVTGKTVPEVTELLVKKYGQILREPSITVVLKDFEKPYFIANGELGRPGKYELRGDTTVLEGIGIAGGINERSKHTQVLLFRKVSDQWMEVKQLDLKTMIKSMDLSEDLHLRPGDMIYVPKNTMSKIKPWIPIPTFGVRANP